MSDLLIYGSYGYTGELIADRAVDEGLDVAVAGRNEAKIERQSDALGVPGHAVDLDDDAALRDVLEDVDAVLHCAGPFVHTYEPMVEACLRTGTHYLDITGEVPVFEGLATRDGSAEEAGVTLLPGVGFDVVPTDCLAAHLADRVPDATHLDLAFDGLDELSPGTAASTVEHMDEGVLVREDGELRRVPMGRRQREIDFGHGPRNATAIPWGDVATAYRTTGIPNVAVYLAVSPVEHAAVRSARYLGPLIAGTPLKGLVQRLIRHTVPGPDERALDEGRITVWGEARDGETATARLETPNGYALTRDTAVESARRVLDDDTEPGFQTPAGAFGADYVLDFDGVERHDE